MGRILGNPYGEIRGKVGGSVFSRNKGGAIMRVYAKPTNANSQSQRNQRNNFRSMSGTWNALTAVQRQMWESFAKNGFNPLLKTNTGNISGVNAMKANKTTCAGTAIRTATFAFKKDGGGSALAHTSAPVAFSPDAPVLSVRPNQYDSAGVSYPFGLSGLVVQASGPCEVNIDFIGVPGAGITGNDFEDENQIKYGFAFYLSDSVKALGSKPKSIMNFCIGSTGIITWTAGGIATGKSVEIKWDAINLIPNFISYPQVGSNCLLTVVVIGENGTQSIACSEYVTITA